MDASDVDFFFWGIETASNVQKLILWLKDHRVSAAGAAKAIDRGYWWLRRAAVARAATDVHLSCVPGGARRGIQRTRLRRRAPPMRPATA